MADDPVRVVSMTNDDGGPSQPVRITNMDALVDALRTMLALDLPDPIEGNTVGSHTEDPALWEDLRFPAQGINPVGSPAPATLDNGADYPGTLLFAGNQENVIAGVAQLPHAWKEGTVLSPHIHWTKVTADGSSLAVDWEFRYRIATKAGLFTSWSAWQDHTLVVGDNTSAEKHNLSTFPDIDMTGYLVSDMLVWSIRRNGNTDAYNGQTRLLEFDIHYQAETLGSVNRASK